MVTNFRTLFRRQDTARSSWLGVHSASLVSLHTKLRYFFRLESRRPKQIGRAWAFVILN